MDLSQLCKCGHKVSENDGPTVLTSLSHDKDLFDEDAASFVHLPPHNGMSSSESSRKWNDGLRTEENGGYQIEFSSNIHNQGILNQHHHINMLLQLSEAMLDVTDKDSTSAENTSKRMDIGNICLCQTCILRISTAIDQNIDNMKHQILSYESAIQHGKENDHRFQKAISISMGADFDFKTSDGSFHSMVQEKIQSLKEEYISLDLQYKEQETELEQINIMIESQIQLARELTAQEDQLFHEYHAIEIDNEAFHIEHRHLTLQCHEAERERYFLEHVSLHTAMYNIIVDSGGASRLYPLINGLRLTYRPKNDIRWNEINAAWSQAVQLIMCIASSIRFQSKDIRIVPLVPCSKIIKIYKNEHGELKKTVHHLGAEENNMERKLHRTEHIIDGITAFHSLLFQIMECAQGKMDNSGVMDNIPFDMSEHQIGQYSMQNIDHDNNSKWSGVVHAIACNLKWLSDHVRHCN